MTLRCPICLVPDADCVFNYGDMLTWAFDLRIFATGTAAVAVAASALLMVCVFLITALVKSRSVRIIGGLDQPVAAGGGGRPPSHDNPPGDLPAGSLESSIQEAACESSTEGD